MLELFVRASCFFP